MQTVYLESELEVKGDNDELVVAYIKSLDKYLKEANPCILRHSDMQKLLTSNSESGVVGFHKELEIHDDTHSCFFVYYLSDQHIWKEYKIHIYKSKTTIRAGI